METAVAIVAIIFTIIAIAIYHSLFNVVYLKPAGCITELAVCGIIGYMAATFVVLVFAEYWKWIVGVIIIAFFAKMALSAKN